MKKLKEIYLGIQDLIDFLFYKSKNILWKTINLIKDFIIENNIIFINYFWINIIII